MANVGLAVKAARRVFEAGIGSGTRTALFLCSRFTGGCSLTLPTRDGRSIDFGSETKKWSKRTGQSSASQGSAEAEVWRE